MKASDPVAQAIGASNVLACIQLGLFCVTDIQITAALCMALWHEKTGFVRTDYLLSRLFIYSLNRGLITMALELVELGTYAATLNSKWYNLVWTGFHYANSKV